MPTEGLTRIEDAMDADAPANLQYGRQSLTITGETNQAQGESEDAKSKYIMQFHVVCLNSNIHVTCYNMYLFFCLLVAIRIDHSML